MSAQIACPCCGGHFPVGRSDVGRRVNCPTCNRIIVPREDDLIYPMVAVGGSGRRLAWAAVALAFVAGLGLLGWVGWEASRGGRPQADNPPQPAAPADPGQSVAAITPAPGSVEASPTPAPATPTADPPTPLPPAPPLPESPAVTEVLPSPREVVREPEPVVAVYPSPRPTVPVITPVVPASTPAAAPADPAGPRVVEVPLTTPPARPTVRVAAVGKLAKRIDGRSADELRRELLAVREVALDTPAAPRTTPALFELAKVRLASGGVYPGPLAAARGRPDLAGLPFRAGADAALFREKAEALDALSKKLRTTVQACIPGGGDSRPDPDKLHAALLAGDSGLFRDKKWATAEAVPCIQQMLQAEDKSIRRMSVELLRGIDTPEAAEALVRWAVFDIEAENRAAALDALAERDRSSVVALLLGYVRYPWPRAAEHAAEALVALNGKEAVPELAALLALPDPDSSFDIDLGGKTAKYRREVVRVNHARNCAMCHPPSFIDRDLVRGAVPDPSRPLPPPTTPSYYNSGGAFVHASTTYLRQDFSLTQPVPNPGLWPDQQRYDYLVSVRPAEKAAAREGKSPYAEAVLFALRELTGRDLGTTADSWLGLRAGREPPAFAALAEVARYLVLISRPEFYSLLKLQDFGRSLLDLDDAQWVKVLARLRRVYGVEVCRLGLTAYLDPLTRSADATVRDRAKLRLAALTAPPAAAAPAEKDDKSEVMVAVLQSKSPAIRSLAETGLVMQGWADKAAFAALVKALKDSDAGTREDAAAAIASIGRAPVEVHEALAAATADKSAKVRLAAAEALTKLRPLFRSAAARLAEALAGKWEWDSKEQKDGFYAAVLSLFAELGPLGADAYPRLLRAAAEGKSDVPPVTLGKVLAAMGPPPKDHVEELAALLAKRDYRTVAETALLAAGDPAVPALIGLLATGDESTRTAAAALLGKVASLKRNPPVARSAWTSASDALAAAKVNDRSPDVRAAAADALKELNRSR